ncbi:PadR family transcriptional regulator [Ectothiorhodospiraceae bacterium WFHF3C12]|nr:PadR family transcriptional regulator [Ectothiorhodospiraceae bacterium WFHF3C12]
MSLKYVLLVTLTQGEMTGYDIASRFDRRLSFVWHATHQQVYRELRKLEEAGLVLHRLEGQAEKPDRKLYRLTAEGESVLHAWLVADNASTPAKVKEPLLVKCFAGDYMPPQDLLAQVREAREGYRRRLAVLKDIEKGARADVPRPTAGQTMAFLALRRGIRSAESWIEWADEAEQALLPFIDDG